MNDQEQQGKVPPGVFERIIRPHLGAQTDSLLEGPAAGVDVGVVDIGGGRVLISTTDPIAINPVLGMRRSAWMALHIIASDLATSGVSPQFFTVNLSLPLDFPNADFEEFWLAFHKECEKLGVTIAGGHTGRYEGCSLPMVGSGTAIAVANRDDYITSRMAQAGDKIVVTKQPGLEAAVMLSFAAPRKATTLLSTEGAEQLQNMFPLLSVVRDAAVASSVGLGGRGVTSMHDATEGGLLGGLMELADASQRGLVVERERIPKDDAVETVCAEYGIDPLTTVSEGCLIVTVRPEAESRLHKAFETAGIASATIGEIQPLDAGRRMVEHGAEVELTPYKIDRYWDVYFRALESESAGK